MKLTRNTCLAKPRASPGEWDRKTQVYDPFRRGQQRAAFGRSVASINSTPMRTADDFYHLIGMTDNFFACYWCLCVSISFILFILFHKRTARNVIVGWKTKKCALHCPHRIFLRVYLVQMSSKKAGNGISGTLNWKFSEGVCSQTPSLTFLPVRKPSKSGWVTSRNHQAYFIIFHRRWRINSKFAHKPNPSQKAEARNCNQPFNLMPGKRANFFVGSKL